MDDYTRRVYLARVRDFAGGASFPSTGEEVLAYARRQNTPSSIIGDLDRLRDRQFASLSDLVQAIGALRFGNQVTSDE